MRTFADGAISAYNDCAECVRILYKGLPYEGNDYIERSFVEKQLAMLIESFEARIKIMNALNTPQIKGK